MHYDHQANVYAGVAIFSVWGEHTPSLIVRVQHFRKGDV